jgi:CheY-like chemotaxis protein/HPt (histidine-containing phosphotransfer) domain-containing protein
MADAHTLLLVDDDATTRELLSLLLSNAGWIVTVAADGAQALQALHSAETPAVILSDLQMPGICGPPLAEAIRTITSAPILLAMTATPLPTTPSGYDALLIKPFRPAAVQQNYEAVLQRAKITPATTGTTSGGQLPVLDPIVLEQLQATMPPNRLHALLAFVADDADGRVTRMNAAALAGNETGFRKEAHALKGSCGMVGALRLREYAHLAEDEGLPPAALTEWKHRAEFVQAIAEIRLMLETLSRGHT